jgi:hypothetical protein
MNASGLAQTLTYLTKEGPPGWERLEETAQCDAVSVNSQGVEVHQLSDDTPPPETDDRPAGRRQPKRKPASKRQNQKRAGVEKDKAPVDPCKYKTKLCRTWMRDGYCSYEGVCCYAHGEQDFRTIHQNTQVLSSLGYFSELMLLAVENEGKTGPSKLRAPKNKRQPKVDKVPAHQQVQQVPATPPPTQPMVHLPYSNGEEPQALFNVPDSKMGAPNYSAPPDFAWQYPLNEAARAYVPYKMGAGPYGDDVHPAYKVPFNALESPPNPYTVAQLPYSAEPYSTYQPQYGEARQGARVPQYNQEAHGYVMFSGNTNEGVNAGSGGPNRMQLREVLQVMNDQSRSNTKHRHQK